MLRSFTFFLFVQSLTSSGNFLACNIYELWQPDELHQVHFGFVKDVLHTQLKYLKYRNVKDQFDN